MATGSQMPSEFAPSSSNSKRAPNTAMLGRCGIKRTDTYVQSAAIALCADSAATTWTGAPTVSGSRGGLLWPFKRNRCSPLALFAAERVERMEAGCSSCWNVAGCERDQENQDCGQDKCQPIAETQTIN